MIKEAAIKLNNKIWTGKNHEAVIMNAFDQEGIPLPINDEDATFGFVDDNCNFLTREEAFIVAKECDQLEEYYKNKHYDVLQSYMLKK